MNNLTIIDHLKHWAEQKSKKTAFNFLNENIQIVSKISYGELDHSAQQTAKRLLKKLKKGDRLLILLPMGPEYLELLLGCFYAGIIAVPGYPPKNKSSVREKIEHIIQDASPALIITDERSVKWFRDENYLLTESIESLLNTVPDPSLNLPQPGFDDIAFLQYSSGSTGQPKGVIITHRNILKNLELIIESFAVQQEERLFSWLPVYHDMGLIGCMLMPICVSVETFLMNPFDFIRKPYRWLEGVSKYKATVSGAPNFAFELVANKVDDESLAKLDLSSWRIAFNGAEPIRKTTVERFIRKFSACGFKAEAMHPVYGLAESGLFVTGVKSNDRPSYYEADTSLIQQNTLKTAGTGEKARSITNVGQVWGDMQVKIVNSDGKPCADHEIGEVVIAGESVTQGYWNRDASGLFIDMNGMKFLKTGDYGSLVTGSLYITGRLKEMLIIRGKNVYPQDIEYAVQTKLPELQPDAGAAFLNDREELVLVQELNVQSYRKLTEKDFAELAQKAVKILSENFSLKLADFVLLKPMQIPKTSSGKIRRIYVSGLYRSGELASLFQIRNSTPISPKQGPGAACINLISWLREYAKTRIDSRLMDERRCISPHIILDFGRKGILGMEVPQSMGGLGFSMTESMAVIQQLASVDVTLASFVGVHVALGTRPILNFGSSYLKNKWLRAIAEGRVLSAFAITENNAGSNPRNLGSVAKRNEKGWILNGSKKWIGTAAWSNLIIVIAQTVNEKNEFEGLSAFAVETNQPGVEITDEHLTMGVRAMVQNSIAFTNLQLSEEQLIGKAGRGMEIAQDAMNSGRLGIGAMALGAMKKSSQMAASYAINRDISTGKLMDNPASVAVLKKHQYAITCSEALVFTAARLMDENHPLAQNVSMVCKVFASEKLSEVLDSSLQLLGGRGYIENNLMPQLFRDGRLLRIFEGPTEALIPYLGSDLLNNPTNWKPLLTDSDKDLTVWNELDAKIKALRSSVESIKTTAKKLMLNTEVGELLVIFTAKACLLRVQRNSGKYKQELLTEVCTWLDYKTESRFTEWKWKQKLSTDPDNLKEFRQDLEEAIGELQTPLQTDFGKSSSLIYQNDLISGHDLPQEKESEPLKKERFDKPENQEEQPREIAQRMSAILASELKIDVEDIRPDQTFTSFGIDSIDAVSLIVELEQAYDLELDPSLFWKHPTIGELSEVLSEKIQAATIEK